MSPKGLDRAFFTNSGSEANDTVIKLVWFYNNAIGRPEKKKFIARTGGYHGITIASGSLTGLATNHRGFDLPLPFVKHVTTPVSEGLFAFPCLFLLGQRTFSIASSILRSHRSAFAARLGALG